MPKFGVKRTIVNQIYKLIPMVENRSVRIEKHCQLISDLFKSLEELTVFDTLCVLLKCISESELESDYDVAETKKLVWTVLNTFDGSFEPNNNVREVK